MMGYLLTAANREWNQPKRKKYAAIKPELSEGSEELLDIKHGYAKLRVCPAGFQSYFGPVLPLSAPFPMFWNGDVYIHKYMHSCLLCMLADLRMYLVVCPR